MLTLDGVEDLDRPLSESLNGWLWDSDVAVIEQVVRAWFLPAKQEEKPKNPATQTKHELHHIHPA